MITLEEAQKRLFQLAAPLPANSLPLAQCSGKYLAENLYSKRTQPAADLSAMDGAMRFDDRDQMMTIIGESAAGHPFDGEIGPLQSARIFTGAHVPKGADSVLIQENADANGTQLKAMPDGLTMRGKNIRKAGSDFREGDLLLAKGVELNAGAIAAAAMAGFGTAHVGGMPKICIIGSGDELVPPGQPTQISQIPSSNNIMLSAMLSGLPCAVSDGGIVRDDLAALADKFADCADYDIIVTSGGASVGDHDLVQAALLNAGAKMDFWRVAIKPGKPIMLGKLGKSIVIGLPGNPGSAFVTAFLFLLPLVRHLAGANHALPRAQSARANADIAQGGKRAEFLRGILSDDGITPLNLQDSGMTSSLSQANALIIRKINAPATSCGELVQYFPL